MWKWLMVALLCATMNVGGWITYPKQSVFILGSDIGRNGEDYSGLYEQLYNARYGETIYIILYANGGGWAAEGYKIHDAIRDSKATVTTVARGEVSSAALSVLFGGKYVDIPKHDKKAVYVAHMQFIGDMYHPIRPWFLINEDRVRMVFYKAFLSEHEYQRVMRGENVWLNGINMCKNARNKLIDDADHCIIDNRTESQ